ncbi:MAG: simple sugar transport system ATP-binding protein [Candidatus Atribacteria bacterium]|nr:simple sugar transport system ATP-binding protein [Candidatus Atribacteria bacterium]
MAEEFLKIQNVSKSYAGVRALNKVSMSIGKGEIHCLVGENGSGKSTLIKIVAGVVKPDEGEIIINDKTFKHLRPIDSISEGIQVIYQDLSLFPNLSVAENISLNQLIEEKKQLVNWKEIKDIAEKELSNIKKEIDLNERVENLSIANKQLVAICRALIQNAKLIIMDEPTTAITKKEIDYLLSVILDLKKRGISTLFVSHKLSEVLQVAERVTVLRDGKKVGDYNADELDYDTLSFYMSGKKIVSSAFSYEEKPGQKAMLEVKNLSKKDDFKNINFQLKPGEIVGLIGPLGSGRTELALSLFGLNKPDSGEIYVDGSLVRIDSPQKAINLGLSYLPEDRLNQGLFLRQSIQNNLVVTILKKLLDRFKLLSYERKYKYAKEWVDRLNINTPSLEVAAQALSGGNQQRVVLAKWLATNPKMFILDSPTVGIDIASKNNIHNVIKQLAKEGMGIIMISDEIPEVVRNCNRIMVMIDGSIVKEVKAVDITEDELFDILSSSQKR